MQRAFSKSERINQVERILLTSRTSLSQAQLARACRVDRATIHRLIPQMIQHEIPVRYDDQGLLYIERSAYLSTIKLRLHEAVSLFLAGRLLARYNDKPSNHTVEALSKLGTALAGPMPVLGQHISATSNELRTRLPEQPGRQQRVLEVLADAWARSRKVQIWYRPLRAIHAVSHLFAPYFLEPSGIGLSVYAVGLAEPPGKLRTRKLERIERIVLTDESFEVPSDFDPNALLKGAWGIWFDNDDQPTRVTLRFSGIQATRRVRETVWHPSQQLSDDPEGRLIWSAEVDEPLEMLPWIRGWGADCELLEPTDLREQLRSELRRLARLYRLADQGHDPDSPDPDLLDVLFGG